MASSIPQIDKDITANRKLLLRRQRVADKTSAADWQSAWDAEPALKAVEAALWLERGTAQLERDRRDYEAALKSARTIRAIKSKRHTGNRCPSCHAPLAA